LEKMGVGRWEMGVGSWELGVGSWELRRIVLLPIDYELLLDRFANPLIEDWLKIRML
jgi:hypothetical protein